MINRLTALIYIYLYIHIYIFPPSDQEHIYLAYTYLYAYRYFSITYLSAVYIDSSGFGEELKKKHVCVFEQEQDIRTSQWHIEQKLCEYCFKLLQAF